MGVVVIQVIRNINIMLSFSLMLAFWGFQAHAQGNGISYSYSIPTQAHHWLRHFQERGRDIDHFVSNYDGQWIVTSGRGRIYSSTSYFDDFTGRGGTSLRAKLNEYLDAGRDIDAIAMTRDGNWLLVSGRTRFYSSLSKFDEIGLRPKLTELVGEGFKIKSISIAPNDGWVIVTEHGGVHYRNVPNKLAKQIRTIMRSGRQVHRVVFRPHRRDKEWVILAENDYRMHPYNEEMDRILGNYQNSRWIVNELFLTPRNGWSVVANSRVPVNFQGRLSQLEYGLRDSDNSSRTHSLWRRMQYHKVPAVSYAIIENGRVLTRRTYGYRDYVRKDEAYYDTLFGVASLSKAVGGAVMSALDQRGRIDLDRSIRRHLRVSGSDLNDWYQSLNFRQRQNAGFATLADLLSHTGGFNIHGIGGFRPNNMPTLLDILKGRDPWTRGKVLPVAFPRTEYDYSGGGYTLAEKIVEDALGQRFHSLAEFNFLLHLGMRDSTFRELTNSQARERLARRHTSAMRPYVNMYCPSKMAGGLLTTVDDYATFLIFLMNDGVHNGQRLFDQETMDRMLSSRTMRSERSCSHDWQCSGAQRRCVNHRCEFEVNYGLGVTISSKNLATNRATKISHGGSQVGISTQFVADLQNNRGIVVFTNGSRNWTDDNGVTRGSATLVNEIVDAYKEVFNY